MGPLCRPRRADARCSLFALLALAAFAFGACASTAPGADNAGAAPDMSRLDPAVADEDQDGYTARDGDCDDHDPDVHRGAPEICFDHVDQDCDGAPDEQCDDDRDGTSAAEGDCNDADALVNPGAMEVWGNRVDDNCDGHVDEIPPPCDVPVDIAPEAMAAAVELCAPWVITSRVNAQSDARARAVLRDFGLYRPHAGRSFVALSTGVAGDQGDPGFVSPQPGTEFGSDAMNPLPMANANNCGAGADEAVVHDYIEWKLTLRVPTNARSLHFDFMFVSAEYPEFVCSQYNDKFLALLDSKAFKGNVSFDAKGHPVTVNVGFFDVCASTPMNACGKPVSKLAGTGYERFDYMDRPIGGGTDWLRTTFPVTPGETIELRFILFDEGDHRFDSTVILDAIQFELDAAAAPVTIG